MIFRNNTRRFLLLALLLALALAGNLSFNSGTSARTAVPPMPPSGCTVVGWGNDDIGQATPPAGLSGVAAVAAGEYHSLALKSDGTVVAWGDNFEGQATPPAGLSNVTAIAAGGRYNLALKSDGTVVGWGSNGYGQLNTPAGLSGVTAIAAGDTHSLALKSDGTVVGWGNNNWGQATPPAGLSGVTAIAGGHQYSLALKSDGTVVGWGNDFNGQATPPAGLSGVTAIAAGASHSLALKSDGTVVGWGNTYGSGAETPPAGLSGVTAIAAASDYFDTPYSLALKSDGTVVGWGYNGYGQATPPAGLSGVTAIAAGHQHGLAVAQCAPSNNPPTISAVANSRQQGAPASASTIATVGDADQSAGLLTVTVNGGASATVNGVTVSGITNTNGTISATIGASCTASNASFTLTVTDNASATATATLNVTVTANTAPTLGSYPNAGPITAGAGTTVTPSAAPADNVSVASVTVAGSAGFTGTLSVNPTSGVVTISNAAPTGMWVITVTATDNCGAPTTRQFTLTVNPPNTAPVVTITGPASGSIYPVGTPVNFTGTFTDAAGETHTAQWMFDTITQSATVVEPSGSTPGSANATYIFTQAGVYAVKLTVTDNGSLSGTDTTVGVDNFDAMVVVYDPSAGWVTGGGWINSPAGAYVPDPSLTGKANFGFVSKYQNGNSVPTGNTEFHFKAGDLKFKSTSYEWMVISGGKKAQYKGFGTINGSGNYRFMLTAIDGDKPGGGGQDKFRIRIWSDGGGLVYDNQLSAPDSDDPTTVLGGGSIQIHN